MGGMDLGEIEWKDLDIAKLIFWSSLATVLDNSIMYPLWTLKTRQQVQTGAITSAQLSLRQHAAGLRGLYRGFMIYSVAALPAYLVYLTTYTYCKSVFGFSYAEKSSLGTAMVPLAAGVVADAACLGLYVPVEIVVQRLQLPDLAKGVKDILSSMWKEQGFRAFYRGFGATVITSAVSSGIWWFAYENLKRGFSSLALQHKPPAPALPQPRLMGTRERLQRRESSRKTDVPSQSLVIDATPGWKVELSGALQTFRQAGPGLAAGFCAGSVTAFAANPLDVVKTRLQTQKSVPTPLAFFSNLRMLIRQEGFGSAFLRGIKPKLMTTAPLSMLSSIMYESILYLSRKDDQQHNTEGVQKR